MKHILLAATALVLCGGPVFAQTSTSGATVTTGSQSQSGSAATSTSNPQITGMSVGNGTSASNSGATAITRSLSGSTSSASPTQTTAITINTGSNSGNTGGRGSRAGSNVSGSGTVAGAASGSAAGSSTRATRRAAANGSGSGATPIASGSGSTPATTGASTGVGATATDPNAIPTTGIQYSGGTNSTQTINGTQTIKNTPEVIAPSIVGGNPCSVGVSGGIGLPGFGITGGGTWADKGCERRQVAALLWNIEQHTAALEVLCKDGDVRDAMKIVGTPCAADRQIAVASVPAPAPAVITTVLPPVAAPQTLHKLPDWCSNVSKNEWKNRPDIRAACG